jgi:hypothetical protein
MTNEEAGILAVVRLNKANPRLEWKRTWTVRRFRLTITYRSAKNLWGRFGGGWNWKCGFMIGGKTLIVDLLVASIRVEVV